MEGRPGACDQDKITVSDGEGAESAAIGTLCGEGRQQRPAALTSTGNCMNVLFTADEALYGAGFRATFSAITPGAGSRLPIHPELQAYPAHPALPVHPSDGSTSSGK